MSNNEEHIKALLRNGETPIEQGVANDIFNNINKNLEDTSENIRMLPGTSIWKKPIIRWLAASILLNIGLGTVVFLNYSDHKDMRLMNGLTIEQLDSLQTTQADTVFKAPSEIESPR